MRSRGEAGRVDNLFLQLRFSRIECRVGMLHCLLTALTVLDGGMTAKSRGKWIPGAVVICALALVGLGCGYEVDEQAIGSPGGQSGIQSPPGEFGIVVARSDLKGAGGVSIGKIHNDALAHFESINTFDQDKVVATTEEYVNLIVSSTNAAFATNGESTQITNSDVYAYAAGLFDLLDNTGANVFTGEMSGRDIGDYYCSVGFLTRAEADWFIGYLDAVGSDGGPIEVQMAINQYTMEHGIPYPGTPLSYAYEVGMYSTGFWGDSKRFNWRSFGARVSDVSGLMAGAYIAGQATVGNPWAMRLGGGVGATLASTGFEAAWDAIDGLRN